MELLKLKKYKEHFIELDKVLCNFKKNNNFDLNFEICGSFAMCFYNDYRHPNDLDINISYENLILLKNNNEIFIDLQDCLRLKNKNVQIDFIFSKNIINNKTKSINIFNKKFKIISYEEIIARKIYKLNLNEQDKKDINYFFEHNNSQNLLKIWKEKQQK